MSKKLPFHNVYKLRLVSENDLRPCVICYKPSNAVLITLKSATTLGKTDFFYICQSHLSDKNFCHAKYIDDNIDDQAIFKELNTRIQTLQKKQFNLKEHLKNLEKTKADSNKIQISNIVSYFNTKKEEDSDDRKTSKVEDLDTQISQAHKDLDEATQELDSVMKRNTKYQLDQNYFQMRLKRYGDLVKKLEQQTRLSDPSYFPSVAELPAPGTK